MELFFLALVLVGFSFIALGINIFFRKNGKFPETEVGQNKNMRELGINCTKCSEMRKWKASKMQRTYSLPEELNIDFKHF